MLFQELVDEVLEEDMKEPVGKLIEKKIRMSESDKEKRIPVINDYLLKNIVHYKDLLENMIDDRLPEWEELDHAFLKLIDGM